MLARPPEKEGPSGHNGGTQPPGTADDYRYETYIVTDRNIEDLQNRAVPIYRTFRPSYVTAVNRVSARITEGAIVRFASTRYGESVGFVSYNMRDISDDNKSLEVADIATIVVETSHRRSGIGTRFFKDIAEENVPDAFTGCVQEPYTHVAKLRTDLCDMQGRKEDDVYPLEVIRPLIKVLEIGDRTKQVTEWMYGICVGYFPLDERARRLEIDKLKQPEAYDIYEAWLKTGFKPENGDGKRYWLPTAKDRIVPREPIYLE